MQIVIDIPRGLKTDFEMEQWTALSCAEMKEALMNGTVLPDNPTNGDVIKAIFPDVVTDDLGFTVHAQTKVTCSGDKHCKGAISYDFWKEWWNAPYKGATE